MLLSQQSMFILAGTKLHLEQNESLNVCLVAIDKAGCPDVQQCPSSDLGGRQLEWDGLERKDQSTEQLQRPQDQQEQLDTTQHLLALYLIFTYVLFRTPTLVISSWFLADRLASRLSRRLRGSACCSQGRLGLRVKVARNLSERIDREEVNTDSHLSWLNFYTHTPLEQSREVVLVDAVLSNHAEVGGKQRQSDSQQVWFVTQTVVKHPAGDQAHQVNL